MLKLNGDLMIGCFKDATARGIMNDKIKIRTGISWDIYIYINNYMFKHTHISDTYYNYNQPDMIYGVKVRG